MVADAVVIVALYYVERGMKAEKALGEFLAEKEMKRDEGHVAEDKDSKRSQKVAIREEQKMQMKNQKHHITNKKNGQQNTFIHQPSKSKRT